MRAYCVVGSANVGIVGERDGWSSLALRKAKLGLSGGANVVRFEVKGRKLGQVLAVERDGMQYVNGKADSAQGTSAH